MTASCCGNVAGVQGLPACTGATNVSVCVPALLMVFVLFPRSFSTISQRSEWDSTIRGVVCTAGDGLLNVDGKVVP